MLACVRPSGECTMNSLENLRRRRFCVGSSSGSKRTSPVQTTYRSTIDSATVPRPISNFILGKSLVGGRGCRGPALEESNNFFRRFHRGFVSVFYGLFENSFWPLVIFELANELAARAWTWPAVRHQRRRAQPARRNGGRARDPRRRHGR